MGRYFMFIITTDADTDAFLYPRRKFSKEELDLITEVLGDGKENVICEDNPFVESRKDLEDGLIYIRTSDKVELTPENLVGRDIDRVYIINENENLEDGEDDDYEDEDE